MLSISDASPTLIDAASFTELHLPHAFDNLQNELCFALSPACQGGLILQKSFYADFVAPGAVIGGHLDSGCTKIYAIGKIQFQPLITHTEKQQALQQRIQCIEKLYHVTSSFSSLHRAILMINQLCDWVGIYEATEIPSEWVAQLAGVQPKTVALAWQKYWQDCEVFVMNSVRSSILPSSDIEANFN